MFKEHLYALGACYEAVEWVGGRTLAQAWAECPRGDWLLWYAARTKCDRGKLVLAACACARTALPYASGPEALAAIETAEAWCRGEATLGEVRAATDAAANAADEAYAAAWAAAWAADEAYAAYTADEAARAAADAAAWEARAAADAAAWAARAAADAAAWAARAAADEAADEAASAANADAQKTCADLVRGIISVTDIEHTCAP